MLTIVLPPNTIKNILNRFESIEFIENHDNLDECIIIITKNGFHKYLEHFGLMKTYKEVASVVNKGIFCSSEISRNIGQKDVIVITILQEWEDLGYINLLRDGTNIEIKSFTSKGRRFIDTLSSNNYLRFPI